MGSLAGTFPRRRPHAVVAAAEAFAMALGAAAAFDGAAADVGRGAADVSGDVEHIVCVVHAVVVGAAGDVAVAVADAVVHAVASVVVGAVAVALFAAECFKSEEKLIIGI